MPISSSLFDTFSLHATVTKNGSTSLEIDIPRSEFRKETRRIVLVLFIALFLMVLMLLFSAVASIIIGDEGILLTVGIPFFAVALIYAIVIFFWKRRFFRHEIIELTPSEVWMTVNTITNIDFLKKLLCTSQYDIESNKESEVVIENRSLKLDEFFRARIAPSRDAHGADMRRVVLGDLEFGRGLNIIELASLVSEINAFLE